MEEEAMLQHAATVHHRELLATTGVKLCGFTAALASVLYRPVPFHARQ